LCGVWADREEKAETCRPEDPLRTPPVLRVSVLFAVGKLALRTRSRGQKRPGTRGGEAETRTNDFKLEGFRSLVSFSGQWTKGRPAAETRSTERREKVRDYRIGALRCRRKIFTGNCLGCPSWRCRAKGGDGEELRETLRQAAARGAVLPHLNAPQRSFALKTPVIAPQTQPWAFHRPCRPSASIFA